MTLSAIENPPPQFPNDVLRPDLFAGEAWSAIRTKPRHEKMLAWELKARSLGYYLPLISHIQASRERKRVSLEPLFSGYLFLRGGPEARRQAWDTKHVLQVMPICDGRRLCDELRTVARVLEVRRAEPCACFTAGRKVRIVHGPLTGIEGIVIRRKGQYRILLQITSIQQAMQVDVHASEILID